VQLHVLLNDGVRFDAPGRYRLYMEDRHDGGGIAQFSLDAADRRPIVSNIIELEILPRDERLDDEAVTAALRILDTSTDERARVDAAITLRIVSSPRAIDEMAHRLSRRPARGGDDGGFELGLFAARDRTRAIARMEAELDDPDRRMPLSYERALAALRATTGNPDGWLTQAQKREALVTVDRRRLRALQKAGTLVASLAAAFETASNSSVSVRPQGNLVALTPALAEFAAEASAAMSRVPRSKRDWAVQQHAFVFQDVRFVPMLERLARSGSVTAAQLLCEARGCTSAADESTSGVVERQADEEPVIRFFAEEWRPDPYSLDLYGLTLRQLDRRIARFPPGTSFHWDADELYSAWDADVEGAFRRVQALVARHGMTLHRRTPSR
jgi:hypothetical protein